MIPGPGGSPGEGNGNPLKYSCLENSMDRGSGGLKSMGHKELDMTDRLTLCYFIDDMVHLLVLDS